MEGLKLFRAAGGNLMMPRRAPRDVSSEHRFREGRCDGETFVQLHIQLIQAFIPVKV
jgi:hypothetical protein